MISRGAKKYLIHPSLGLIAGILYIVLLAITGSVFVASGATIIVSIIIDTLLRVFTKASVCSLLFLANAFSLTFTLGIWAFNEPKDIPSPFYIVFYEVILVCIMIVTRFSKTYISLYLNKTNSIVQKTFLGDFFETCRLVQYTLTIHIFVTVIYVFTQENLSNKIIDPILFYILPSITFIAIIAIQEIKARCIIKQLRKEEWLPIVNEAGEVSGRVARSVSAKMKNRFMHPVVRIALVHEGSIYLQQRADSEIIDPSKYDHPFEKYMLFNDQINITVRNSISRALNMQELPFKFLTKYVYENEDTKRLIFLFVARVENKEQLKSISLLNGKFWTLKQIEESFSDDDLFAECFQLEYEYLKNMVVQPPLANKDSVDQK